MGTLIAALVGKQIFGHVIGEKLARVIAIGGLVVLILSVLYGGKCAYDANLIGNYEAKQGEKTAKADKKADNHAAEQRRKDDARTTTEAQEIKEAVNEAGPSPIARRNAYYSCVSAQQAARRERKPPADC